jgi:hypothetical protein
MASDLPTEPAPHDEAAKRARLAPDLNWSVIAPLALLAAVILAVIVFDFRTGGDVEPAPLLGAVGSPVRGTFVPPTATPVGGGSTPRPRPTFAGSLNGTPAERDQKRRNDLLVLVDGFNRYKEANGSYPSTTNNVQTLCAYKDFDVGCKVGEVLNGTVPLDPLNDPVGAGYWYASDGQTGKLYASLEEDIPPDQQCRTEDAELKKKFNLICVTFP